MTVAVCSDPAVRVERPFEDYGLMGDTRTVA
jgi:hypothetical protein